jgi:DNA-binding LacI/PurR family transcriptional regulator
VAVTLRDVAAAADVSIKTVSNVVNGYPGVRPQLRARVQQAIDDLGYRPNLSARSLRTGRTGIVALAVPALQYPYFADLATKVVSAATERGWNVLVEQTEGMAEREAWLIANARPRLIDGVILSPLGLDDTALQERRDPSFPLVLLGELATPAAGTDHVVVDNVAAAADATRHLLDHGRRAIAVIGTQPHRRSRTSELRLKGYRAAMRAARIRVDRRWVGHVQHYQLEDGRRAVRTLLDSGARPDALFCFNDLLAHGAMRGLHELGVRVPDDIAVVGFDNDVQGQFSIPSLTSVAPDKGRIAALALSALAERLDAASPPAPRDLIVPHELVVRESSLPAAGDGAAPTDEPSPAAVAVASR